VPGNSLKEIKRKSREEEYYKLFPNKRKDQLSEHQAMDNAKQKKRKCEDCKKFLCLFVGVNWMCWSCQYNPYKRNT
jgi:recombinational DNA repair protein RecR